MSELRTCATCKHHTGDWSADPCKRCSVSAHDFWEPVRGLRANIQKEDEMGTKTVKELNEIIEQKEQEIKTLREEVKTLKAHEDLDKLAVELKAMYDSLVKAGFSEDKAFILFNTMIGQVLTGDPSRVIKSYGLKR